MEYFIEEYNETYGWCLFRVCKGNKEFAEKCLKKEQEQYPNKQLRLAEDESKNCWWNDQFLSN